jgi:hypothetical protein
MGIVSRVSVDPDGTAQIPQRNERLTNSTVDIALLEKEEKEEKAGRRGCVQKRNIRQK